MPQPQETPTVTTKSLEELIAELLELHNTSVELSRMADEARTQAGRISQQITEDYPDYVDSTIILNRVEERGDRVLLKVSYSGDYSLSFAKDITITKE